MWIEEVKTNKKGVRYKYSERYTDITGKERKVNITLNSNSRQAVKMATEELQKKIVIAKEKVKEDTKITFKKIADEWQAAQALIVKPVTAKTHKQMLKKIHKVLPVDVLLLDLTAPDIKNAIHGVYYAGKGLSYTYSNQLLTTIKQVFQYAKDKKKIAHIDEIQAIKLKRKAYSVEEIKKKNDKFLNRDELKEVLSKIKAKNKRVGLAMEFMSLTGVRIGELLALRNCDYDKEHSQLSINGTICFTLRGSNEKKRGTPKNIYSNRVISLCRRSMAILDILIMENRKRFLWSNESYIFTGRTGQPLQIQVINRNLAQITINGKHITSHVFRHTHISILCELGVPLKAIMARVGHNNPNTTLAIYTHVTERMNTDLINKLEDLAL